MNTVETIRLLYDYDHWANREAVSGLAAAGDIAEKARQTMAHLLSSQRLWLMRLRRQSYAPKSVWDDATISQIETLVEELAAGYTALLTEMQDADLDEIIEYRSMEGTDYVASRRDILLHVITHGAYHRGQIATRLRIGGGEPVPTDYIRYAHIVGGSALG